MSGPAEVVNLSVRRAEARRRKTPGSIAAHLATWADIARRKRFRHEPSLVAVVAVGEGGVMVSWAGDPTHEALNEAVFALSDTVRCVTTGMSAGEASDEADRRLKSRRFGREVVAHAVAPPRWPDATVSDVAERNS